MGISSQHLLEFCPSAWVLDIVPYLQYRTYKVHTKYVQSTVKYVQSKGWILHPNTFPKWQTVIFRDSTFQTHGRKRNIYIPNCLHNLQGCSFTMKSDLGIIMQNTVNYFSFFCISATSCLFNWPRIRKGHILKSNSYSLCSTKTWMQFWWTIYNSWIKCWAGGLLKTF